MKTEVTNIVDFWELIQTRRSIRSYKLTPVEPEKIEKILQAGRMAPSALNRQEWHFIVVRNKETLKTLARICADQSHVAEADTVICLCGYKTDYIMSGGEAAYSIDLAIAGTCMMFQATELELGTCWIGAFNQQKLKSLLRIPDDVTVVSLLTIGYPHYTPTPTQRKPLSEIVSVENYTQPYE